MPACLNLHQRSWKLVSHAFPQLKSKQVGKKKVATSWKSRFCPNLRTSSTIKPLDLASWVRKFLLLRPIFLSTRYSLTSLNFTSPLPGTPASAGLGLFLTWGTIEVWNISLGVIFPEYIYTRGNLLFNGCCVQLHPHPGVEKKNCFGLAPIVYVTFVDVFFWFFFIFQYVCRLEQGWLELAQNGLGGTGSGNRCWGFGVYQKPTC